MALADIKNIPVEELAKLNTRDKAAIAYRGKVYDVSSFLDFHPGGGDQLLLAAGRDVTGLFDSYHWHIHGKLKQTSNIIAQKCRCIGELEKSDSPPTFPERDELYEILQQRVLDYFTSHKKDPKIHIPRFCSGLVIAFSTLLFWYLAVIFAHSYSLLAGCGFALLSGFFSALLFLNVSHDVSHFSWTHKPWVWKLLSTLTHNVLGLSSYVWAYQHVIGHHCHPNHHNLDPDVGTKKVWRIKSFQDSYPHYAYQHIYMPLLYTLLSIKMKVQDFHSMASLKKGHIAMNPPSSQTLFLFILAKLFHLYYRVVLPYPYLSLPSLLLLNLLSEVTMGFWLGIIAQVNHVNTAVVFPDPTSSSYNRPWSEMQIATTVDYATDSMLWLFLSGGLNCQVAHHLFPSICSFYYKDISQIVRKTCEEFGIDYCHYNSFWETWCSHMKYLHDMGKSE